MFARSASVDLNEFRCQWEQPRYFNVSVLREGPSLLVQCTPEVDLPVSVQFVLALFLFGCVSCLRADMYKRRDSVLISKKMVVYLTVGVVCELCLSWVRLVWRRGARLAMDPAPPRVP